MPDVVKCSTIDAIPGIEYNNHAICELTLKQHSIKNSHSGSFSFSYIVAVVHWPVSYVYKCSKPAGEINADQRSRINNNLDKFSSSIQCGNYFTVYNPLCNDSNKSLKENKESIV